jgi:hypothetical protein
MKRAHTHKKHVPMMKMRLLGIRVAVGYCGHVNSMLLVGRSCVDDATGMQ